MLTVLLYASAHAVEVDFVVHWNGAERGVISNVWTQGITDSSSGDYVGWGQVAENNGRIQIVERTNNWQFPISVTLSNAAVTGDGTNMLYAHWGSDTGTGEQRVWIETQNYSTGPYTNLVVAGFIIVDTIENHATRMDVLSVRNAPTGATVLEVEDTAGASYFLTHTIFPTTRGQLIAATRKKAYWVVVPFLDPGTTNATIRTYDPENGYALVGESPVGQGRWDMGHPWRLEFIAAYLVQVNRGIYFGPMVGIYNPTQEDINALVPSVDMLTAAAIQAQVDAALDGDTILLPAGYCEWGTNDVVTINRKAITLKSSGGTVLANVRPGNTGSGVNLSAPAMIVINPTTNGPTALSGITFTNVYANTPNYVYVGNGDKWGIGIVTNCVFLNGGHGALNFDGLMVGLAAGNVFADCRNGIGLYALSNMQESWVDDLTLGTTNVICVESNYFATTPAMTNYVSAVGMIMNGLGSRAVIRYNTWTNTAPLFTRWLDAHGNQQPVNVDIQPTVSGVTNSHRGTRQCEAYENLIVQGAGNLLRISDFRGGTLIIATNRFLGASVDTAFYTREEDDDNGFTSAYPGMDQHWLYISGNTVNGSPVASLTYGAAGDAAYLLEGTNVFFSLPGSGTGPVTSWTPLTYPHQLRGGGSAPSEPGATNTVFRANGKIAMRGRIHSL